MELQKIINRNREEGLESFVKPGEVQQETNELESCYQNNNSMRIYEDQHKINEEKIRL